MKIYVLLLAFAVMTVSASAAARAHEWNDRETCVKTISNGADWHRRDLRGARIENIALRNANLSGADLRDLYYLVGVRLPNTGTFHLHGRIARRDRETVYDALKVVSGQSDVQGRVSLETQKSGRTLVNVDLSSALLRLADVGLRAGGRDPHPDAPPRLFSDVQLITAGTRRVDATGKYSARRLLLSRVEATDLSAPFKIERGLIKAPAITGHLSYIVSGWVIL